MHALEYLAAGLIMIVFISFSSAMLMPSVYIPLTHIKEQQLDVLAERITDKILLTPGAPYDWHLVETEPAKSLLIPTSVGKNTGWTVVNGTLPGILTDADDSTYIFTSNDNKIVELDFQDLTIDPSVKITEVIIWVRGKGNGSVTVTVSSTKPSLKDFDVLSFSVSDWLDKPFKVTKTYGFNEINSMVISIESKLATGGKKKEVVYCSEVWVEVRYVSQSEGLITKSLNGFGLALYEEDVKSLGEPYVLDRDKVLRLTNLPPNSSEVAKCLGLMEGTHLKYGFEISIKPALNISTRVLSNTTEYSKELYKSIHVKVKNYEGRPLAKAKVYGIALLFYIDTDQKSVDIDYTIAEGMTDVLGEATLTFDYTKFSGIIKEKPSGNFDYTFLYITYVDFYSLKSYAIDALAEVETPALIVPTEDGLTVLHDESDIPRGSIHMRGVFGVNLQQITSSVASGRGPSIYSVWVRSKGAESYNIINHGGREYIFYSLQGVEQELNAIGICFKYTGQFRFYIASLRQSIGEELIYSTSPRGAKKTIVVAKRLVRIEGMDYVFEFKMWRMAED